MCVCVWCVCRGRATSIGCHRVIRLSPRTAGQDGGGTLQDFSACTQRMLSNLPSENTPCDSPWISLKLGSTGESWKTRASTHFIDEETGSRQGGDLPGAHPLVGSELGLQPGSWHCLPRGSWQAPWDGQGTGGQEGHL